MSPSPARVLSVWSLITPFGVGLYGTSLWRTVDFSTPAFEPSLSTAHPTSQGCLLRLTGALWRRCKIRHLPGRPRARGTTCRARVRSTLTEAGRVTCPEMWPGQPLMAVYTIRWQSHDHW